MVYQSRGYYFIERYRALSVRPKKTEIPGGKSNGTEISIRKVSKIVVYLSRLSSFSWNSNRMVSAHRVERFCADKHGVGLSAELPNSTQNGVGNCGVVDVLRVYISFRRRNMSGVGSHGMPVILATAGYDHTIRFWQAHSGICHRTVQHPDSISFPCLLFSFR